MVTLVCLVAVAGWWKKRFWVGHFRVGADIVPSTAWGEWLVLEMCVCVGFSLVMRCGFLDFSGKGVMLSACHIWLVYYDIRFLSWFYDSVPVRCIHMWSHFFEECVIELKQMWWNVSSRLGEQLIRFCQWYGLIFRFWIILSNSLLFRFAAMSCKNL